MPARDLMSPRADLRVVAVLFFVNTAKPVHPFGDDRRRDRLTAQTPFWLAVATAARSTWFLAHRVDEQGIAGGFSCSRSLARSAHATLLKTLSFGGHAGIPAVNPGAVGKLLCLPRPDRAGLVSPAIRSLMTRSLKTFRNVRYLTPLSICPRHLSGIRPTPRCL